MTKKIMYGINVKEYEDLLTKQLRDSGVDPIIVKTVTYREAILEYLPNSGAEVLIFRDTLDGSMDIGKILEQVRMDYPDIQIIFLCSALSTDPLLARCVSLGIYDIINNNSIPAQEVVNHVLHPSNFHDVYQYYRPGTTVDATPSAPQAQQQHLPQKKQGLFSRLMELVSPSAPAEQMAPDKSGNLALPPSTMEPKVNQELIRETIQENAARVAQENMDALIKKAVKEETEKIRKEKESVEKELADVNRLMQQREARTVELISQLDSANGEIAKLKGQCRAAKEENGRNIALYEEQIAALRSDKDTPVWYAKQEAIWKERETALNQELDKVSRQNAELNTEKAALETKLAEATGSDDPKGTANMVQELSLAKGQLERMKSKLSDAESELDKVKAENQQLKENGFGAERPDYPALTVPNLEGELTPVAVGPARVIAALGAKHGVGNTTMAMNIATMFAVEGHKTALIELNDVFPLTNEFFELTNVPIGLNAALDAAESGNTQGVDSAIIRFRAIKPLHIGVSKAYKRLPSGLHLMVYSNEDLIRGLNGNHKAITKKAIRALTKCLVEKQGYTRVIYDVQAGDRQTLETVLEAGGVDKLVITLGQDTHGMAAAGAVVSGLCKADLTRFAAGAEFVVMKHNASVITTVPMIAKNLNAKATRFSVISEDTLGYMNADNSGIPYVVHGGVFANEYKTLCGKLAEG